MKMPVVNGMTALINPYISPFKCTALKFAVGYTNKPFLTTQLPEVMQHQIKAFCEEWKKLDEVFDKVRTGTSTNRNKP